MRFPPKKLFLLGVPTYARIGLVPPSSIHTIAATAASSKSRTVMQLAGVEGIYLVV